MVQIMLGRQLGEEARKSLTKLDRLTKMDLYEERDFVLESKENGYCIQNYLQNSPFSYSAACPANYIRPGSIDPSGNPGQ
jgi:hypothetical protein